MRTLLTLWTVALVALAGCSGGGSPKPDVDPTQELGLQATATTGVIRGVVVDETITPLEGVTLTIAALNRSVTSNAVGAFGFDGLEPGTYFLSASKPGYKTVQQSAEVNAGEASPAITKIQLAADPTTRPAFDVFHFQGYLECSAVTLFFFWPCEVPFVGPVGNDHYFQRFELANNASFIHVSLVWDATQAFGQNLYFNLLDSYDEYNVAVFAGGPSPLVGDANATALAETDINAMQSFALEVASDGESLDGQVPSFFGASIRQAFDAYIVAFYGFEPPEGYAYHKDGDPQVPS